ncbi:DUF1638 domain-containing protein [Aeromicrobium chenweiae]|uniref:Uncharacterized protein n=1 Tax=Aeromicrobium chenweiae TaxID=2079793 RepID=A0A2S0WJL9_9ACTN|nr:DUF1638 domain-containing protein [Aeromicrobium chenweiae]AWB91482.1 hypothetical protein C3E78_04175 [Aeromicrobium chenweiae]TGN29966.1 DUF1638 domain-containing protein [Aeromicrobium chenweiae]
MSSSRTDRTSTTGSSTSSPSPSRASGRTAVIACGAIAQPVAELVATHVWPVDVHPLPPLLHNAPHLIAAEVEELLLALRPAYGTVAIAYADCGTYGELDAVCERHGVRRLAGLHCYDVFGGTDRVRAMFEQQPGTYVLTDFLVRSFRRTVVRELGLDRHPELRDDYFQHYTRVVWLAQEPDDELRALAADAAEQLGLPLTEVDAGLGGLDRSMRALLGV